MKKLISAATVILFSGFGAQAQSDVLAGIYFDKPANNMELTAWVQGNSDRPVHKEQLEKANIISDFVEGYPTQWIDQYVLVEILTTNNGTKMRATGTNQQLTAVQKHILTSADLASDIQVKVKYKSVNAVSNEESTRDITINMTVLPETQAAYIGGTTQMTSYFKENLIGKIPASTAATLNNADVVFTVNANGEVENARIQKTSGDKNTDTMMLEAVNKMPKWKPAENAKGIKVKQEFRLTVGKNGC